ncbi:hypothetical protein BN1708_017822, partial [Verticillium longisporum]
YKRFHDLAEEFHDRYTFAIASRATDGSADELGEDAPSDVSELVAVGVESLLSGFGAQRLHVNINPGHHLEETLLIRE